MALLALLAALLGSFTWWRRRRRTHNNNNQKSAPDLEEGPALPDPLPMEEFHMDGLGPPPSGTADGREVTGWVDSPLFAVSFQDSPRGSSLGLPIGDGAEEETESGVFSEMESVTLSSGSWSDAGDSPSRYAE